jgi:phosphocarrier protein
VVEGEGLLSRVLTIVNTKGLHARASAKFVQCAAKFDAQVMVAKDGSAVSGTSIMGLMMLGAGIGSEIAVSAAGREAEAALDALAALVASRFGEDS